MDKLLKPKVQVITPNTDVYIYNAYFDPILQTWKIAQEYAERKLASDEKRYLRPDLNQEIESAREDYERFKSIENPRYMQEVLSPIFTISGHRNPRRKHLEIYFGTLKHLNLFATFSNYGLNIDGKKQFDVKLVNPYGANFLCEFTQIKLRGRWVFESEKCEPRIFALLEEDLPQQMEE